MLMGRRKVPISFKTPERWKLIHPEMGGGLGWIPGDKRIGIFLPQEPPALEGEDFTLFCPLRTSNSQLCWNFRVWFGAFGQTRVPEPAISSKNWISLRNHRVGSHKSQIIQTRWEKWASLRHFEAFQLLLKHLPREVSQHFGQSPWQQILPPTPPHSSINDVSSLPRRDKVH